MRIRKRKKTWIYVVAALLLCAIVGGCVYAFVGTDNKDNMKKISPTFSLGGLDENGKYVETKESIYTKDAFECKGLTVTPEFESQVTYQIFFYDSTGEFISKTEKLEKVYKDEVAIEVTHARIVITPNEDEDGNAVTMNVFNKSKYAKQLTLKVDKVQKTFTEIIKSLDNQAVLVGTAIYNTESHEISAASNSPFYFFAPIDVSHNNTAIVYLKTESLSNKSVFSGVTLDATSWYDDNGEMTSLNLGTVLCEIDGYSYVAIDVSDLSQIVVCTDAVSSQVLEVYLK